MQINNIIKINNNDKLIQVDSKLLDFWRNSSLPVDNKKIQIKVHPRWTHKEIDFQRVIIPLKW
jgi:hypothetical protein